MARKLPVSAPSARVDGRAVSAGPAVAVRSGAVPAVTGGEMTALSMRARMSDATMHDDLLEAVVRLHWYALVVQPQKEFVAQKILRRYGLKTFIPVRCEWRRVSRFSPDKVLVKCPGVPRYVFIGLEPGVPLWFDIESLPVVSGIVGIQGKPMRISPSDMRTYVRKMSAGVNAADVRENMRVSGPVSAGGMAIVTDGPFTGQRVPVLSIAGDRAKARLMLFGGAVDEIELALDSLAPA